MKNDIYFMNLALNEAKKAYKKGEIPVGAVIIKNNKVISKAYNMKEKRKSALYHAEMIAINKASKKLKNWRLNDCIMYITLFPCPMCASAINQSRISKVVYGTIPEYVDNTVIDKILNDNKYGIPVSIEQSTLNSDCLELLKKFFKKKRG